MPGSASVFRSIINNPLSSKHVKYYLHDFRFVCIYSFEFIIIFSHYRIGVVFTNDELLEMVIEADINGDQLISFDEFRDIFNEG